MVLPLDGKLLNKARGLRYLIDALDDVSAAEILLDKSMYALVMFHCQQASEKASKACLSVLGIVLADEHKYADFLQKMVVPSAGKLKNQFQKLMLKVSILESLYVVSRYGVDKKGRIHFQEFDEKDVVDALNAVQEFVELCFLFLESKFNTEIPRQKKELILYLRENYKQLL